jgi:uncharacterized C2H2 Zn-finger protein
VLVEELPLYNFEELQIHLEEGEVNRDGEIILFHPRCQFCEMYFFDMANFVKHMKKHHETCHSCGKDHPHRYYRDYEMLSMHFEKTHFVCKHGDCAEQKFVVFRTYEEREMHNVMSNRKCLIF